MGHQIGQPTMAARYLQSPKIQYIYIYIYIDGDLKASHMAVAD